MCIQGDKCHFILLYIITFFNCTPIKSSAGGLGKVQVGGSTGATKGCANLIHSLIVRFKSHTVVLIMAQEAELSCDNEFIGSSFTLTGRNNTADASSCSINLNTDSIKSNPPNSIADDLSNLPKKGVQDNAIFF